MTTPRKRAAFFDVDNTLIKGSSLYFLGRGMYQRGFFSKKDISRFVLANLRFSLTGKENPEEIKRWQDAATDFIGGHDVKEIEVMAQEIYDKYISPALWEGTIAIAENHLANGEEVWLVTAAPEDMAHLISQRLGFTGALGSKAEHKDGKYTGAMIGNLLHGKEKATAITELALERGFDLSDCYAYSDSHNDCRYYLLSEIHAQLIPMQFFEFELFANVGRCMILERPASSTNSWGRSSAVLPP